MRRTTARVLERFLRNNRFSLLLLADDAADCQLGPDGIVGTCDTTVVGTLLIGAEGGCDEGTEGDLTQINAE